MKHVNLVPTFLENINLYSFSTPEKNINFVKNIYKNVPQHAVKFLYDAKQMNAPGSSFTIPLPYKNKQKTAFKVFQIKDDEIKFEFSKEKLEFDTWMLARDCSYADKEQDFNGQKISGGKIWVEKMSEKTDLVFHSFHCFNKYEDAVRYKKLIDFQIINLPESKQKKLIIMPVEIDTTILSSYEIVYLPYLNYAIFGVNTTLMYIDSNNIII